jgi:hypothetical protein
MQFNGCAIWLKHVATARLKQRAMGNPLGLMKGLLANPHIKFEITRDNVSYFEFEVG